MASLSTRVISAFGALFILLGATYWGGPTALVAFTFLIIFATIYEYDKIAFLSLAVARPLRILFVVACLSTLLALTLRTHAFAYYGLINCLMLSTGLWIARNRMDNNALLQALAICSVGILYCVVLPSFAAQVLFLTNGIAWFYSLLIMVFMGDICAYFGGYFFGKTPLMPSLSPKKTIEGSVSGFFGTALSGSVFGFYFLPHVPTAFMILMSLVLSFAAQNGDLFASLVKRVAKVKDSGHIMPGHGGVLDRFDGVYFAAPILFTFASYFETSSI